MTQHPEHIIHVVAHQPRRVVGNHLRRAQRVKVVPLVVPTHQRDALQIQRTHRPAATLQRLLLLHQLTRASRYPTGIPRPHPVHVVLPPPTTAVKTVTVLIRQRHVSPAVVPTNPNQPALLVILQQPRVTRPRKTRQRAVRVPDVGLGGVGCSVYYLNQPACAVMGIRATMRQMVKVLKVFRNLRYGWFWCGGAVRAGGAYPAHRG